MSPILKLKMLFHLFTDSSKTFGEDIPPSLAKDKFLKELISDALIIEANTPCGYAITNRGLAFIEAIKETPLPIKKTYWAMSGLENPFVFSAD